MTPRRLRLAGALAAAVVVVLLAGSLWRPEGPTVIGGHPLQGKPAPDFELTDLDGRKVHLAGLRGRPVIVYFWASWCIPCRTEFPLLKGALEAHADDGLAVIGVVFEDSAENARGFMADYEAPWPAVMDPDHRVADAYRVHVPPLTFYVDATGIVRTVSFGPPPSGSLEGLLAKILPAASPSP